MRLRNLLLLVCTSVIILSSCSTSNPLKDPRGNGADLPEPPKAASTDEYLFYSSLKYQEIIMLENSQANKVYLASKNKLYLESAANLRLALQNLDIENNLYRHEFYQDLLVSIALTSPSQDKRDAFIERLIAEYENYEIGNPTSLNCKYLLSRALVQTKLENNIIRAVSYCADVLEASNNRHYKTLLLLGRIFFIRRNFKESIKFLKIAVSIEDNFTTKDANKLIAIVYKDNDQLENSIKHYQYYIENTFDFYKTIKDYEYLAMLFVSNGDYQSAEQLLGSEIPPMIAAQGKCHHLKILGWIESLKIEKITQELQKNKTQELILELNLLYKNAEFNLKLFLEYYPEDKEAQILLQNLKQNLIKINRGSNAGF